ncbi:NAD(P)-binding domain-containing protein [Nanchangia anserum]|uniref:NAD(P)-binding domain-containing protein n=1 Tax=Nanchangia anserum TaxID=2692125 RepID=A0A8I0GEV6_9ACTO|nr:NAD(P)-binding domain-containing protein [Nanchangia anserum]MBD3688774.1 NAD(P)-binding domain-containing protein [Nanchangia anserum]QOX82511.1 NAD(P)-binding domain-containing protein [Nanchangia anserum]
MTYAAVVGDPVDHSLSPLLHRAAYAHLGLDWDYRRMRVRAGEIARVLADLDGDCVGLSVTMPHKQDLAAHLDHVDGLAQATGAINTVVSSAGMLAGFNTDVYGIVEAVRAQVGERTWPRVCILGAGATAASAMAAAIQLGCRDLSLVARAFSGPKRAAAAAHRLGVHPTLFPLAHADTAQRALAQADLVISTLPGEAAAPIASQVKLRPDTVVLDVSYAPRPTPWERACAEAGATALSGLHMLIHQALMQVQLFSSRQVSPEILYGALEEAGITP